MADPLGSAALAFLAGAGLCLVVGSFAIRWLTRMQCVAPIRYGDCPPLLAYHAAKRKTQTMGGVFVLMAGIAAAAAAGGFSRTDGWLVCAAVLGLGAIGLLDDWLKFRRPNARGLRSLPKLLVALLIGAAVGLAIQAQSLDARVVQIPWLAQSADLGWGWVPFAAVVVAGCAHAVNLTDGLDGLAPGCVAIALSALGLLVLAGDPRHRVLIPWCAGLSGACVGFLWFNAFPASIVLGDVGALGLGAALATVSLLTQTALWLVVIGGVFVAEALSVMLQVASYRWRGKRRIFRVAPLHHHVHLGGLSEPKVMVRFWVVGLILAMLGLTRTTQ